MRKQLSVLTIGIIITLLLLCLSGVFYQSRSDMLFSVQTEEKIIALTFDDGPNPDVTPQLLDELDNLGVKATFFISGKHGALYPEILSTIQSQGHEIGNHGWTHQALSHFFQKIPLDEVQRTNELIREVTGKSPTSFRPPYLTQKIGLKRALTSLSLNSIGAGVNGSDWSNQDPKIIAEKVLRDVKPGRIILLHDGDGGAKVGEKQKYRGGTLAATPIIVKALQKEGFRFVVIKDLIALKQQLAK